MSGLAFVVDTCVISRYVASKPDPNVKERLATLLEVQDLCISWVTFYELRRGLKAMERRGAGWKKRAMLETLLRSSVQLGLDEPGGRGWHIAADLHASGAALSPPREAGPMDLLIAATALHHDLTLLTADNGLVDFMRVVRPKARVELL